jgi:transketolase
MNDIRKLEDIANRVRINVVKMIAHSGIGHAGGASSIAEILSVLYFREMNIDPNNPKYEDRDRFILSKGHGCPALYAIFAEVGFIPESLMWTLHNIDSPLQMHPELGLCPGIEMSTGALGQGLSAGIGMALGARMRKKDFRVYVLIGDGETNEGQIWEAAMSAAKFKLDNLVVIMDNNKFSLSDRTQDVMPLEPVTEKWASFGWFVSEVDGHAIKELIQAFENARQRKGKPSIIIAHTVKGRGIPSVENKAESHSVSFTVDQTSETLYGLGCSRDEVTRFIQKIKEKK